MSDKATQASRYVLTAQGCLATGGHSMDDGVCRLCGIPEEVQRRRMKLDRRDLLTVLVLVVFLAAFLLLPGGP